MRNFSPRVDQHMLIQKNQINQHTDYHEKKQLVAAAKSVVAANQGSLAKQLNLIIKVVGEQPNTFNIVSNPTLPCVLRC